MTVTPAEHVPVTRAELLAQLEGELQRQVSWKMQVLDAAAVMLTRVAEEDRSGPCYGGVTDWLSRQQITGLHDVRGGRRAQAEASLTREIREAHMPSEPDHLSEIGLEHALRRFREAGQAWKDEFCRALQAQISSGEFYLPGAEALLVSLTGRTGRPAEAADATGTVRVATMVVRVEVPGHMEPGNLDQEISRRLRDVVLRGGQASGARIEITELTVTGIDG